MTDIRKRTRQFEAMRTRLFGLAYRMLQTREDAEEVVQDAWLRFAGAKDVSSPEGFLLRVTTRLCLDREKSAARTRESYLGPWLADLVDPAPTPEEDAERLQSLNLGLLHVLLMLGPLERAVFLLREAFDYSFEEIGAVVGRRSDACRQIARRARARVQGEGARVAVDSEAHASLLGAFLEASTTGQVEQLEALLTEDVVLISDGGGKVVAATRPIQGPSNVARFMTGIAGKAPDDTEIRFRPVNGAPAAEVRVAGAVTAVFCLDLEGSRIRRIFAVRNPDKLTALH